MAVKALTFLKSADFNGSNLVFQLKVTNAESPYQSQDVEFQSTFTLNSLDLLINQGISGFVKDWTNTNWGTTWGLSDTVRLMIKVDGLIH